MDCKNTHCGDQNSQDSFYPEFSLSDYDEGMYNVLLSQYKQKIEISRSSDVFATNDICLRNIKVEISNQRAIFSSKNFRLIF